MTYSLVQAGTVASVSGFSSPLTATCASTTAHNLLVAVVSINVGGGNVTSLPAGWVQAVQVVQTSAVESSIWYYPDCPAGITSVAVAWTAGSAAAAQIMEFHDSAGTNTSPVDVTGTKNGISAGTPQAIATGSSTAAAGELAIAVAGGNYSSATKDTLAAGAGFTHGGNYGDGVKQTFHAGFDYELVTGAAGIITDSVAFTGPFNQFAGAIATFKIFTLTGTNYRIWPATSGPAITADTANTDLGIQFKITNSTSWFTGYYQWLPATGDTVGSHYTFRLYSTTNGTTGTILSAATVTGSGTLTAGAWNFIPVSPAVALTSGTTYTAVISYSSAANHYGSTANYWTSGAGSAGITQGPITVPNNATSLGAIQSPFNEPGSSVFPVSVFNASNYWTDVQVTDTGGPAGLLAQQLRSRHPAYWTRIASPASSEAVYTR